MARDRVEVRVFGIASSLQDEGMFALLMGEVNGSRRIPIVVAAPEAHAIAVSLSKITLPRPVSHDILAGMAKAFDIEVVEVFIYKYEQGIFFAEIVLADGEKIVKIDSRTSDAIAFALRAHCLIYMAAHIVDEAGIHYIEEGESISNFFDPEQNNREINEMSDQELKESLSQQIKAENYERAAEINAELSKRKHP